MMNLPKNIENICRLCLTESVDGSDMLPMFPVRGGNPYAPHTVVSKILQCTTVKIQHYQGAPTTICEYCNARLDDWQSFREQCVGTDEYLKATYPHIFNPEGAKAEEIIKHQTQVYQQQREHQQQWQQQQQQPYQQQQQQQKQHQYQQQQQPKQQQPQQQQQQQQKQQQQQTQQQQKLQEKREKEFLEQMTDLTPPSDDGSFLIGEEISPEDMMDQFYDDEQDEMDNEELIEQLNRRTGIRMPKWSREFGAKLNSLLHVVGGERPHQCKVCRKRFLRRPHCRRHVAQAHGAVIESVKLPSNWQATAGRRFSFAREPVQQVMEPVPPSPPPRVDFFEPTVERPYQCEVCKKCFKRSQHLRRHRTSHLQIEIDRSEIMRGITEQQRAQHQLTTLTNLPEEDLAMSGNEPAAENETSKADFDDDEVIALSDDDEDMGEEISPEEFIGSQFAPVEIPPEPKQPRLSDIPHIFYGSDDDLEDVDERQYITKSGTIRKRAPPLRKLPGDRPYQCRKCKKLFKRSDHLKSHFKTHTAETDFTCEYCQKGFRYRQNYLIHMKNKTCLSEQGLFSGHQMSNGSVYSGSSRSSSRDNDEIIGD